MTRLWPGSAAVTVLAVLCAGAASAAPPRMTDEELVNEARKACAADRPSVGIELLADYYARTGEAIAIHNQARCYQQNDMPEKALSRFREYLRIATDITPEQLRKTERHILELEAELKRRGLREQVETGSRPTILTPADVLPPVPPKEVAVAPQKPVVTPPPAPPPPAPPPPRADLSKSAPPAGGSPALRVTGLALGAVALAGVGAGVYFGTRIGAIEEEIDAVPSDQAVPYDTWHRGERAQTLQWIGYGVGLAAAAGSITCLLLSAPSGGARSPALALAPRIGPDGYGASVRLAY